MMLRIPLGTIMRLIGYGVLFVLLMVVLAECGLFGRLEQPAMEPDRPATPSQSSQHGPSSGGERR